MGWCGTGSADQPRSLRNLSAFKILEYSNWCRRCLLRIRPGGGVKDKLVKVLKSCGLNKEFGSGFTLWIFYNLIISSLPIPLAYVTLAQGETSTRSVSAGTSLSLLPLYWLAKCLRYPRLIRYEKGILATSSSRFSLRRWSPVSLLSLSPRRTFPQLKGVKNPNPRSRSRIRGSIPAPP